MAPTSLDLERAVDEETATYAAPWYKDGPPYNVDGMNQFLDVDRPYAFMRAIRNLALVTLSVQQRERVRDEIWGPAHRFEQIDNYPDALYGADLVSELNEDQLTRVTVYLLMTPYRPSGRPRQQWVLLFDETERAFRNVECPRGTLPHPNQDETIGSLR